MEKENRRVKMTKMLLNESFLKFLSEKSLPRITVKEICEEADINRSTYYTYYTDPYDQLRKLEAELMVDMAIYIDGIIHENPQNSHFFYQNLKGMLDYINSKKHIFQVLLSKNGDANMQTNMIKFSAERVFQINLQESPKNMELEKLQEYIFVSTGSLGIIYYWLMKNTSETTEELAKKITTFTENFRR